MYAASPIQKALHLYFPKRLAELRQERQLSIEQLAETTAIDLVKLRRFEAGGLQPTLDDVKNIAAALEVGIEVLLAPPQT